VDPSGRNQASAACPLPVSSVKSQKLAARTELLNGSSGLVGFSGSDAGSPRNNCVMARQISVCFRQANLYGQVIVVHVEPNTHHDYGNVFMYNFRCNGHVPLICSETHLIFFTGWSEIGTCIGQRSGPPAPQFSDLLCVQP
jgi:hypothetical protein